MIHVQFTDVSILDLARIACCTTNASVMTAAHPGSAVSRTGKVQILRGPAKQVRASWISMIVPIVLPVQLRRQATAAVVPLAIRPARVVAFHLVTVPMGHAIIMTFAMLPAIQIGRFVTLYSSLKWKPCVQVLLAIVRRVVRQQQLRTSTLSMSLVTPIGKRHKKWRAYVVM